MDDNKLAHKQLTEELEHFRSLFEGAPLGYQSLDANGNLAEINIAWSELLGYSKEEVLGRSFSEFVHPDSREKFNENFPRFKCAGQVYAVEYKMIKKDGSDLIVSFDGRISYNEDGTFRRIHCVMKDITERRVAEQALRKSEARLASVLRAAPTGIGLVADRVLIQVNNRFCEITGYSEDELEGESARMLYLTDEDFEYVGREKYAQIREHGTGTLETRMQRKDGKVIDVLLSSTPLDLQDLSKGVTFTALDITKHKQAVRALQESEARYEESFNGITEGLGLVDENEIVQFCNPAYAKIFGEESPKSLIGKSLMDYIPTDQADVILAETELRKNNVNSQYDCEIITADGHRKTIDVSVSPRFNEDGEYIGAFGAIMDITDRKKTQVALKESEEKFRMISEQSLLGIAILTKDGFQYVNDAFARLFETEPGEVLKWTLDDIVRQYHPDDREMTLGHLRQKLQEGGNIQTYYELRIVNEANGIKWIANYCRTMIYRGEKAVIVNFIDISQRKQAEEAMEESNRRLEAERKALTEKNIVLRGVLDQIEAEKKQTGIQVHANVNRVVMPVLRKLEGMAGDDDKQHILTLRRGLEEITSPFVNKLESRFSRLTPREVEISKLIKDGLTSKEIAHALSTSVETVRNQRKNIRKKLEIANDKINLSSFLQSV